MADIYKCPVCGARGRATSGTMCGSCNKSYLVLESSDSKKGGGILVVVVVIALISAFSGGKKKGTDKTVQQQQVKQQVNQPGNAKVRGQN